MPTNWHQHHIIVRQENNLKRCFLHMKNHSFEQMSFHQWRDLAAEILYITFIQLAQSNEFNLNLTRPENHTILSQTDFDDFTQALLTKTIPSSALCQTLINNKNQLLNSKQITKAIKPLWTITQQPSSSLTPAVLLLAIYSANHPNIKKITPGYILRYRLFKLRIKLACYLYCKVPTKELNNNKEPDTSLSEKQLSFNIDTILFSLYNLFFSDEIEPSIRLDINHADSLSKKKLRRLQLLCKNHRANIPTYKLMLYWISYSNTKSLFGNTIDCILSTKNHTNQSSLIHLECLTLVSLFFYSGICQEFSSINKKHDLRTHILSIDQTKYSRLTRPTGILSNNITRELLIKYGLIVKHPQNIYHHMLKTLMTQSNSNQVNFIIVLLDALKNTVVCESLIACQSENGLMTISHNTISNLHSSTVFLNANSRKKRLILLHELAHVIQNWYLADEMQGFSSKTKKCNKLNKNITTFLREITHLCTIIPQSEQRLFSHILHLKKNRAYKKQDYLAEIHAELVAILLTSKSIHNKFISFCPLTEHWFKSLNQTAYKKSLLKKVKNIKQKPFQHPAGQENKSLSHNALSLT
jgi:hypothetical protein